LRREQLDMLAVESMALAISKGVLFRMLVTEVAGPQ